MGHIEWGNGALFAMAEIKRSYSVISENLRVSTFIPKISSFFTWRKDIHSALFGDRISSPDILLSAIRRENLHTGALLVINETSLGFLKKSHCFEISLATICLPGYRNWQTIGREWAITRSHGSHKLALGIVPRITWLASIFSRLLHGTGCF